MSNEFGEDSVFGAASAPAAAGPAIDPREHLRILWRRKWLIAAVFAIGSLSSGLYALTIKDVYTAETVLMLERGSRNVINVQEVLVESPSSSDFYNTQFNILRSRTLAAEVIRKEGLGLSVRAYLGLFEVEPIRLSRLVRLRFTSTDSALSARIVNAHAQAFIQRGLAIRRQASDGARGFLTDTLSDLERRLNRSQGHLADFRREHGVQSVGDASSLPVQRLAALGQQLMVAESDRIARGTQLELIRSGDTESTSAFATDPQILQLGQELRALRKQLQSGRTYLPELEGEIVALEAEVDRQKDRVIASLAADYRAASALENRYRLDLAEQEKEMLRLKDASVEYAMLLRENESTQQLYDVVSSRQKELEMAAGLRTSRVFVIDRAVPPTDPTGSSKLKLLLFGCLGGLVGGIGIALALEFLDNNIKRPEDVEDLLGIPYLGTIPDMAKTLPKLAAGISEPPIPGADAGLLPMTISAPTEIEVPEVRRDVLEAREAYLSLRTNLLLSRAGAPPSPILFTSARRGDGKTLTVLNMAVSLAQMGAPVLLIDADMRRPSCHKFLGLEPSVGLTEVLAGHCEFDDAVRNIRGPLSFLSSGLQTPPDPIELLASERMRAVLTGASLDYAYVLIDSPPLLAVSDSVALSPLVDGVVLVISDKTPKPVVQKACARLNYARARLLGAVLNRFDLRSTGEEYVNYYEA